MKVGSNAPAISFETRQNELTLQDEKEKELERNERKSRFKRWTQFNNEHTNELMQLALKYPKAHAILYFLVDQMDMYNAVICSSKVLENLIGVSRQTIAKNIKILKEHGFIVIAKSGSSNVYIINDKVYWKSWGDNRKYSKFPANVILSWDEQELAYQREALEQERINSVKLTQKMEKIIYGHEKTIDATPRKKRKTKQQTPAHNELTFDEAVYNDSKKDKKQ